jgi:phage tail-like protein
MADANQTRFHLLLTEDDWVTTGSPAPQVSSTGDGDDLEWVARPPGLALAERGFVFEATPGDPALEPTARRGSARDRYGTWYTIAVDRSHVVEMLRDGTVRTLWPASEARPADMFRPKTDVPASELELRALTVTEDHYLVVGCAAPAGLFVFDLHGGGPPLFIPFPDAIYPVDMAPRRGCGVLILDVSPTSAYTPRYWKLSRGLRTAFDPPETDPSVFAPKTLPTDTTPPGPPRIDLAGVHDITVPSATSIEGLDDDTVLVMGRDESDGHSVIGRFADDVQVGDLLSLAGVLDEYTDAAGVRLDVIGHDFGFAPGDVDGGIIYVSDISGNQAFAFAYDPARHDEGLQILPSYFPMRSHYGRALVVDDATAYFDTIDAWHPLMAQSRRWYADEGTLITSHLDGEELGCVWHRIFLDGCIPPGSTVQIDARAANDPADLEAVPWSPQPAPYLRGIGSELPFASAASTDTPGSGTWETVLQDATGRFLQIRLGLAGGGRSSPRLTAMRVYFPRFSYRAEYLPQVYGEDPRSAAFLDRYLAITEGLFTSLEDRIANAQMLWDLRTTPDDYLAWLMSWLGVTAAPDWDAHRRRTFLDNANEIFRWRGTRRGLVQAVRLAIDDCPEDAFDHRPDDPFQVRIVERFGTRRLGTVTRSSTDTDPDLVDTGGRWSPEMGAAVLHQRYVSSLAGLGITGVTALTPTTPGNPTLGAAWTSFVERELGCSDAEFTANDTGTYRDYLRSRYRRITAYRAAYGSDAAAGDGFESLALPNRLPDGGAPLEDWTELVAHVLPVARAAHRFTVLVPVPLDASSAEQASTLSRVRHVIEQERPAHTDFEVNPFWAALRVGEARVGLETQVGRGSRFVPVAIGATELARSHLVPGRPFDADDRWVVGRNQVTTVQRPRGTET